MSPKRYKAIIFDVDGVLVDSRNANVAFFQALLKKAGYRNVTREEVLACFHLPLRQSLKKLTGTDGDELGQLFTMAHDPNFRDSKLLEFPEKLEATLEELHKRYKLAIVTSRIKVGVEDIFTARQIRHFFDAVVTFEDYANPKPHPEPLHVALRRLGLEADQAVYVGDSKTDVEAAKAAGMHCIFMSSDNHQDAVARIEKLHEITQTLVSLL